MSEIEKVEIFRINIPLKEPYRISTAMQDFADYVLIRIKATDDIFGIGEASPLPGNSMDTSDQIFSSLCILGQTLLGQDPFNLSNIHASLDKVMPYNLYSKGAIDIALHDYCCKVLNIPLTKFIGGTYHRNISLTGSLGIYDRPSIAVRKARQLIESGYSTLKVKIGQSESYDLEVLRGLRKIDRSIKIRLDGNQAYRSNSVLSHLRKMEKYEPELIEQPLPYWDTDGMRYLTRNLDVPIAADEAVSTPEDMLNIIRTESADLVKVKVMRCGGITRVRRICDIARAGGMPVIIGSGHQSSIGVAAELHVAKSSPEISSTGEMVGHLRLRIDTVEDPIVVDAGVAVIPLGPGLGVTLNESIIANKKIMIQSKMLSA